MPKTTPCPISTLIAWTGFSQKLETGAVTSAGSWRERVRRKRFHLIPQIKNKAALAVHCRVSSVVFGSWYDHVNAWWKKKETYSNLHYMFYEDMIEVSLKRSGCWSLRATLVSELLLCSVVWFCRTLTAKWTNSATFWACPPPLRRSGKSYLMLSLTTWKRTTWSTTPQSSLWTLKFLTSCGKVTWSWHRTFVTQNVRTDWVSLSLQGRWATGRTTSPWHRMRSLMKTTK